MANSKNDQEFSEEEAQRRFLAAVKAGLNTKPKPLKNMVRKGTWAHSKITPRRRPKKAVQAE
jgi:hypothetical protein